jgi:hypothetical protein
MAVERDGGWWDDYRGLLPVGLLDLAEVEHHAVSLDIAVTSHLPGLLQTEDHARALFALADPPLPEQDYEARVELRLKRRQIFERPTPTPLTAIIHEAALRMQFGGREVTRAQLEHILSESERDHVSIHVVPFDVGGFPGAGQSITYAHGPVPQLDTVQLDSFHEVLFMHTDMQLRCYHGLLLRLRELALETGESRNVIRSIAQDL